MTFITHPRLSRESMRPPLRECKVVTSLESFATGRPEVTFITMKYRDVQESSFMHIPVTSGNINVYPGCRRPVPDVYARLRKE